jgi:hypothetical protein
MDYHKVKYSLAAFLYLWASADRCQITAIAKNNLRDDSDRIMSMWFPAMKVN